MGYFNSIRVAMDEPCGIVSCRCLTVLLLLVSSCCLTVVAACILLLLVAAYCCLSPFAA